MNVMRRVPDELRNMLASIVAVSVMTFCTYGLGAHAQSELSLKMEPVTVFLVEPAATTDGLSSCYSDGRRRGISLFPGYLTVAGQ